MRSRAFYCTFFYSDPVVSGNPNRPVFMLSLGSSNEAIRLTAHDNSSSPSLVEAQRLTLQSTFWTLRGD